MRIFYTILLIILLNIRLYAQKIDYSVSIGSNLSFFSVKQYDNEISEPYSPTSGYSVTTYYPDINIVSKPKIGYSIENTFNFHINKTIRFNTGIRFSSEAATKEINYSLQNPFSSGSTLFSYGSEVNTIRLYMLNIPIKTGFGLFNNKIILYGGISLSGIFNAKSISENKSITNIKYEYDDKLFYNTELNADFLISKNLYLGVLFNRNISSWSDSDSSNNYYEIKLNTFSVYLSYRFYSANE